MRLIPRSRKRPDLNFASLLTDLKIGTLLDVGANQGDWAQWILDQGWQGETVSFEPLPDAFSRLNERPWVSHNVALGAKEGDAVLNVAGNSVSSSLLPMHRHHLEAAPVSAYTGQVKTQVRTLDSYLGTWGGQRLALKMDVQGYELEVLRGATATLDQTHLAVSEMLPTVLYEGQGMMHEVIKTFHEAGFRLVDVEPGFRDPQNGYVLAFHGTFVRLD